MPAIKIYPRSNEPWLPWIEVERHVRACFEHVEVDREWGRKMTASTLKKLETFPDVPLASLERLRAAVDEAAMVTAWNGECLPENGVQFHWEPENALFIWFAKGHREHATKLRKNLGYDFEEV